MKFIYCFDVKLKDALLNKGYDLLTCGDGFFIFSNNFNEKHVFEEVDKTKYMYSDKMII